MADSNFYTPEEALALAWEAVQESPGQQSAIISKLSDEFGITSDQFTEYDSTIVSNKEVKILEDRLLKNAEKFENISGFSQSEKMSDAEIIRTFDSLYELEEKQKNIGRVPSEAEWYIAGEAAQERIDELTPYHKQKMKEEWKLLTEGQGKPKEMEGDIYLSEYILPTLGGAFRGAQGFLAEVMFGYADLFSELPSYADRVLHERGFGTSWNPMTGFGTWDIAELRANPETGGWGFSESVLADEEELEQLYSIRTHYNEQMTKGGYEDKYAIDEKVRETLATIPQGVVDPRKIAEIQ